MSESKTPVDPARREALDRLLDGNARFVGARLENPNRTPERRAEILGGQQPFAAILGCADSRVPPEVIFDQGLGDLFVLRIAGNVATEHMVATIEYAVAHLGVPLVMVLGHSRCGAVTATLHRQATEGQLPKLAALIEPACLLTHGAPGDPVELAARLHARRMASRLREESVIIATAAAEERIRVVAAYYDLESGRVEVL
jgi:carbonic anhydrase